MRYQDLYERHLDDKTTINRLRVTLEAERNKRVKYLKIIVFLTFVSNVVWLLIIYLLMRY